MLGIAIDAAVLMMLLKSVNDEDIGFGTALLVALAASVGTSVLAIALATALGAAGIFLAAILAAATLGAALSAMLGMEIKRAFLVAGLFMLVHIGMAIGFQLLLR
jgi:hypothetical protein